MDRLLAQGINFFNSARYFEAHETWEDLWRTETGPARIFHQALIHAAVGMLHLTRKNITGARSQLLKALGKLDHDASVSDGIDVDRLRQDLRKVLAQMDVGGIPEVRIVRLKSRRDVVQSDGTF